MTHLLELCVEPCHLVLYWPSVAVYLLLEVLTQEPSYRHQHTEQWSSGQLILHWPACVEEKRKHHRFQDPESVPSYHNVAYLCLVSRISCSAPTAFIRSVNRAISSRCRHTQIHTHRYTMRSLQANTPQ